LGIASSNVADRGRHDGACRIGAGASVGDGVALSAGRRCGCDREEWNGDISTMRSMRQHEYLMTRWVIVGDFVVVEKSEKERRFAGRERGVVERGNWLRERELFLS